MSVRQIIVYSHPHRNTQEIKKTMKMFSVKIEIKFVSSAYLYNTLEVGVILLMQRDGWDVWEIC